MLLNVLNRFKEQILLYLFKVKSDHLAYLQCRKGGMNIILSTKLVRVYK